MNQRLTPKEAFDQFMSRNQPKYTEIKPKQFELALPSLLDSLEQGNRMPKGE